ncbi:PhoU-like phosphate uptake regulator [Ureibacillus xyleni]|uniref:Phosphate-specific transport system accessory protein PhoU n=1 Tax=Ureibacillus xyleni TaxID=614648 RepID=A0A285TGC9_9BACL|nr:phosphate signaling complex protein PhoU [Ureibacillus xyleni]SOC21133.1 PhoU-like phosphate uptake regulator [Ureibacillus xyleni]
MSSVRGRYDHEMNEVQQDLLHLCDRSILTLEASFTAFIEKDLIKAQEVIDKDVKINRLEEAINDRVIKLLTRQQPVATDLRRLIVLLKAASDMERIGDYAVNIAKETLHIGKTRFITSVELIEDMYFKTTLMLRQIVEAFVEENTAKAKEVAELDDQIDEMYGNMIKHLMRLSAVAPESVSQITYLSFICRYIERCADHATNIAEHLLYLKKGQHIDLNN